MKKLKRKIRKYGVGTMFVTLCMLMVMSGAVAFSGIDSTVKPSGLECTGTPLMSSQFVDYQC